MPPHISTHVLVLQQYPLVVASAPEESWLPGPRYWESDNYTSMCGAFFYLTYTFRRA